MPAIDYEGTQIQTDEDGFITDPSLWNEGLARAIARQEEGLTDLTEDHWKVVFYLNQYFREFGIAPTVRKLCKETGFTLKAIFAMFPSGPARGACKVAGLPKPTGCV